VNFSIDGGAAIPATLNGSGVATTSAITTLTVGTHTVTATYLTDGNFATSTGTLTGGQVVNPAATSTAVSSSANPSVFGQGVTFSATVTATAPGAGIPTGTVNFSIDGGANIPVTLNGSGVATTSAITNLTVGTHTVSATYVALLGGNFATSTGTLTGGQVVNPAATTTAVSSSSNPSVFGQGVTFTATVTATPPGAGTPTGTVNFSIDGGPAIPVTLNGSGVATTSVISNLTVGNHSVAATYVATTNFASSLGFLTAGQDVNPASTTTIVSSSANPSVFGQPVTFSATVMAVAPGTGTPAGTVNFSIDGGAAIPVTLNGSGVATTSAISNLTVGTHTVSATYVATTNFATSTGTLTGNQVVNPASTTTAVTSSLNPSFVTQGVSFTATVAAVAPGVGTPTGTVNFVIDGGAPIPGTLNGSGVASSGLITTLTVGTHTVVATYVATTNFATSTGSLAGGQVVKPLNTTTTVSSSLNPSTFGLPVTFTAAVTANAPGSGPASGNVNFIIDGGTPTMVTLNGTGQALLTTSTLTAGNHTVVVNYLASGNFAASTGTLSPSEQVNQAATSLAVTTITPNPSTFGQTTTYTATITVTSGSAATTAPTGTVTFLANGTAFGSAISFTRTGAQTFTATLSPATPLTVGTYNITATYSGNTNFAGSPAAAVPDTITQAATTLAITSLSPNPVMLDDPTTLNAVLTVTAPGSGAVTAPTGTFTVSIDGTPVTSTMTLTRTGPQTFAVSISVSTTGLTVATHNVTIAYSGNTNFAASTSPPVTLAVTPPVSDVAVSITPTSNPGVPGTPITYNITVANFGPHSVTSVELFDTLPPFLSNPVFTPSAGTYNPTTGVWSGLNLAANQTVAMTLTAAIDPTAMGTLVNTVNVQPPPGTIDPNLANNTATDNDPLQATADLAISISHTPTPAEAGNAITYLITVNNIGPSTVSSVNVIDQLPAYLMNPVFTPSTGSYNPTTGDWTGLTLASGQSATITLTATVAPVASGTLTDTATVQPPTGVVDPNLSNNTATDSTPVFARIFSVVGADAGGGPQVIAYSANHTVLFSFFAYSPAFQGGVRVALADVNGDNFPDIITGAGPGGGPNVKVFDGKTGATLLNFFAYDPAFQGGVTVSGGNISGNGLADIVTGAGPGGGPAVKIFDGRTATTLASFFAFNPNFHGGVSVAVGDVNGDGHADIITGAGPGGGPHVNVFDGTNLGHLLTTFFAYDPAFRGGVSVGAGDLFGVGRAQVITGAGHGGGPVVKVFDGTAGVEITSFFAFNSAFQGGVRVGSIDFNGSGKFKIVTGAGPGASPEFAVFDAQTHQQLESFFVFDPAFQGGIFAGGH
jgi:hypothetical protein